MLLLTKAHHKAFEKCGDTSELHAKQIKVIAKLFNPVGAGTWWLYEKLDEDLYMCFANLGNPMYAELGTVGLKELQSLSLPMGLGIERDIHYKIGGETLADVMNKIQELC